MVSRAPAPGYFLVFGIVFLLWNLVGDAFYLMQVTADLGEMAKTDPITARFLGEAPTWAWSAYAIAVWGATLASILMLMKRGLAVAVYAVSLIAVVARFGHDFFATDMLTVTGWMGALFPIFIFIVGVVELLFARAMKAKGIIA